IRVSIFFQAEDGIRDYNVTGVQTCALPISGTGGRRRGGNRRGGARPRRRGERVCPRRELRRRRIFRSVAEACAGRARRGRVARKIGRESCREREWVAIWIWKS